MKTEKAKVAKVPLGSFEIDGLMMPDGSFGVAVPQVASLFGIPNNNASRDIKALLGADFSFEKWATVLSPKAVNVIRLPDLKKLTFALAMKGNEKARELLEEIDPSIKVQKTQKTQKTNKGKEKEVQLKLSTKLNGEMEINTPVGRIDILTATEVIEVKSVDQWKAALGQVLVYGDYYPSHSMRIHLFGETQESHLDKIRGHCEKRSVIVTW